MFEAYVKAYDASTKLFIWSLQIWVNNGTTVHAAPTHSYFEYLESIYESNDLVFLDVVLKREGKYTG